MPDILNSQDKSYVRKEGRKLTLISFSTPAWTLVVPCLLCVTDSFPHQQQHPCKQCAGATTVTYQARHDWSLAGGAGDACYLINFGGTELRTGHILGYFWGVAEVVGTFLLKVITRRVNDRPGGMSSNLLLKEKEDFKFSWTLQTLNG